MSRDQATGILKQLIDNVPLKTAERDHYYVALNTLFQLSAPKEELKPETKEADEHKRY